MKKFTRWCLKPEDLQGLNAVTARDLVIECFHDAQKETLLRAKKLLGLPGEGDELKRSTISIVKIAFKEIGADFDRPSKETLQKVVAALAHKSELWGTPADIIDHHREQLRRLLGALS